jgi:hypothetical protein
MPAHRKVPRLQKFAKTKTTAPRAAAAARPFQTKCLSYFGAVSKPAHVRYLVRRLRRMAPRAKFLACFWMLGEEPAKLEEWKASVNADFAASSLDNAAGIAAWRWAPSCEPPPRSSIAAPAQAEQYGADRAASDIRLLGRLPGFLIDDGLRYFGQRLVSLLLFRQALVEKLHGVMESECCCPGLQGAVTGISTGPS